MLQVNFLNQHIFNSFHIHNRYFEFLMIQKHTYTYKPFYTYRFYKYNIASYSSWMYKKKGNRAFTFILTVYLNLKWTNLYPIKLLSFILYFLLWCEEYVSDLSTVLKVFFMLLIKKRKMAYIENIHICLLNLSTKLFYINFKIFQNAVIIFNLPSFVLSGFKY